MEQAMIAMSGGVDSSVAAYLALQQGYKCCGATMRLWDNRLLSTEDSGCCSLDDTEDARAVAYRLGMRFYVFNASDLFRQQVVEPFITAYEQGLTPNPCILCNRHLKFTHLLERALMLDCRYVVTGHYARIAFDESTGRHLLYKALDTAKDQTYFLACMDQHQLSHTLFPLGELTKEQVRAIAQEQGFLNAKKRDSQDICFVPDGNYKAFMEAYTGKTYPKGDFLDESGNIIGCHSGAVGYTLGQRKGLGLAMGSPVYVCGKDMVKNTVTVGPEKRLFTNVLWASDCNFIPFDSLTAPMRVTAKARSRHKEQPATVYPEEGGRIRVEFDEPQRAITAGQAVVLYDGDLVIGSGTIL
ncbi:MAG: tRNA 2-thiouridine(34) synthase MnmA [Oscillospiraceae bacterium]|nr:tRNA 2-thiouridine(34) synthase MnmA [Oscillospiraceae bacterium]